MAGDKGVVTADFLQAHLPRFSARIMELRAQGHIIDSYRLRNGSWRYILRAEPTSPSIEQAKGPTHGPSSPSVEDDPLPPPGRLFTLPSRSAFTDPEAA